MRRSLLKFIKCILAQGNIEDCAKEYLKSVLKDTDDHWYPLPEPYHIKYNDKSVTDIFLEKDDNLYVITTESSDLEKLEKFYDIAALVAFIELS